MQSPNQSQVASHEAGRQYAEFMVNEDGGNSRVDIATTLGRSGDMPSDDYSVLTRAGISPDSRAYWDGYNEYVAEATGRP